MNPSRVDSIVDLTYGLLIAVSVGLIVLVGSTVGLAFGLGVLLSYLLHVGWKMARFDPDWMRTTVEETVKEKVGESVEETVGETVNEKTDEIAKDQLGPAAANAADGTGDGDDAKADEPADVADAGATSRGA